MNTEGPDNYRTGLVFLQHFDIGVITTLGGVPNELGTYYCVNIDGILPPPDPDPRAKGANMPGVPIIWANPDENVDDKIIPSIVIRRDSFAPAMSRFQSGMVEYRIPAPGAKLITILHPITGQVIKQGYDRYEHKDQAVPHDITYTIEIRARYRNNNRVDALRMLQYVMMTYQTYTEVKLIDSLGATRTYDAFAENATAFDVLPDISGRENNFNITLRVEGELDLNHPKTFEAWAGLPVIRLQTK